MLLFKKMFLAIILLICTVTLSGKVLNMDEIPEVVEGGETASIGDAAASGALKALSSFIQSGADVNETASNSRSFTPLMRSSERGHYLCALELVKAGSDVNYKSPSGNTAIELAVVGNFPEIVNALLDADADPNTTDGRGNSITVVAAQLNFTTVMKFILARKPDVNRLSTSGESALMYASAGGYVSIVSMLVNASADINRENKLGYTPLMYAASRGHIDVVRLLIKSGADTDHRDRVKMSILEHAVYQRREAIVKELLLAGVEIGHKGLRMDEETRIQWQQARATKLGRKYSAEEEL
jgi:ankyrin repeat protein